MKAPDPGIRRRAAAARHRGPALIALVAALAALSAVGGELPQQSDKGAEGIVHSAPVAPAPAEPAIRTFAPVSVPQGEDAHSATTHCSLDVISGQPAPMAIVVDHRVPVTFVGWAADDKLGVPSEISFMLVGDKAWGIFGKTGLPRPDVVDAKHNPAFANSGYSVSGRPASIPQGEYHAALIEHFGSTERVCPLGRTIAIK